MPALSLLMRTFLSEYSQPQPMRRIYDSDALRRDSGTHTPQRRDDSSRVQAVHWVNSTRLSRLVLPKSLRTRAISIDVSTPQDAYPAGRSIPFTVTMKNSLPAPVTIPTASPVLWTWHVDGVAEASHVSLRDPPDESAAFVFDRGERKQFRKRWNQRFRVADDQWEPAEPGSYTIGAELNVSDPRAKGLYGETTVEILPE